MFFVCLVFLVGGATSMMTREQHAAILAGRAYGEALGKALGDSHRMQVAATAAAVAAAATATAAERAPARKALASVDPDDVPSTPEEWARCAHQRNDTIKYVMKYADLNGDGFVCLAEIERVKSDLLPWEEKILLLFMQSDHMMKNCAGPNGYISLAEFETRADTCLRNCAAVERFFKYFVNRAVAKRYKGAPVECEPPKKVALSAWAARAAAAAAANQKQ